MGGSCTQDMGFKGFWLGSNSQRTTVSAIAPPSQEGWREAPGWWFKRFFEQPPRLRELGGFAIFLDRLLAPI